jgi:uncharacterized protein (TIGR00290 family)
LTSACAHANHRGVRRRPVLLSWSSGKDSAWALHTLRQREDLEVVALLTTVNESAARVAMHGVRESLLDAQAAALGLPLWKVPLPSPCPNEVYEERMRAALERARSEGIASAAFGDLYLEDIRAYRVRQLSGTGIEPLFPIWTPASETPALARRMLAAGLRAVLTCVDPAQIPARFAGRAFDAALLAELPASADPCGERGEFHTFCWGGPMFAAPLALRAGAIVERDGFCFADLERADAGP